MDQSILIQGRANSTRIGSNAGRGSPMHLDMNDDARVIGARRTTTTVDDGKKKEWT